MPLPLSKAILFLHSSKPKSPIPMANLSSNSNFAAPNPPSKARLRGVVFDMDGTLTVPTIDFPAMYRAVLGDEEYFRIKAKNPSGIDILHQIENWSPEKQRKAIETIADFERQGLDRLQIMPGAAELCSFLDSKGIRFKLLDKQVNNVQGLITRNVKAAVDLFHERFGIRFSPALSREFRPFKPDPAPLLHICSAWDVQPSEVMMVGDSLKDDVKCGKQAGAFACLLDEDGRYDSPKYANVEHKPDFKVSSLAEVHTLLDTCFHLAP
ncbi:haloacid dehalogenase-like hydrolase domain-containing protein At2g33255 isoform X1 [Morus notabilis]|uniref:haloacid dehalogenase-like hydrolase domain-containing protein At2g33255 isoform X1 n=1 Tax=Morus notabilis TaxID=981085 RepID=UPI000CED706D|nr:haloacid dehalogenase-like hydrolase domain-containing protein At2g33255 isoform X1 [Morus notabilis]